MFDSLDQLISPYRLAHVLGVEVDTLAQWRRRGFGPAWIRVGRLVRYPEGSVSAWICERAEAGGGKAA